MAGFWEGGPHPTDGLPGYPARDYGAPAGTGVYSWAPLQVTRISGASGARGKGFGGYNVYLKDRTGRQFFLTHVENLQVRVGQTLRPGQPIAQVGNYPGMANHVHIGYQGGDPDTTLGLHPNMVFSSQGAASGGAAVGENIGRIAKNPGSIAGQKPQTAGVGGGIGLGKYGPEIGGVPLGPGQAVWVWDKESGIFKHVPVIGPAFSGVQSAISAPGDFVKWVGQNWDRVAEVVGGAVLILVGILLVAKQSGVVPGGAVGKLQSKASSVDPLEEAYNAGEAQGMASAARSAGRESGRAAYRRSRPSSQGAITSTGDDIPY